MRDCGGAAALRCGGGHNGTARLLGAVAFRSVDLFHSNQLNFMLLTNIILILLTIIDLILFRYLVLFFRRGGADTAVFRRGGGVLRSRCRRRPFPWSVGVYPTTTPRPCRYDSAGLIFTMNKLISTPR